MVTDEQVKLYRHKRMEGRTQEAAAAASGMSVRTARTWERGALPSQTKKPRSWRTRKDPFAGVWETDVEPLLAGDAQRKLQAKTIMRELQERYPERFSGRELRTLQRRVSEWRALHGPPKEVFFPQEHPPGREGAFDFTHCDKLGVTIMGVALAHLLFVFRLSHSGWTWVQLAYSETFEALVAGLQGALWALGGTPELVRHDNLSAATHELVGGGRSLNRRYRDVLEHYDLGSTRIHPGKANENGIAEKGNDLTKSALEQALIVRGGTDFDSIDDYMDFVRAVIAREINAPRRAEFAQERELLRPLPPAPLPSYTVHEPTVRRWSTISVNRRIYSVPSRLIGHKIRVHLHPDKLELFYRGKRTEVLPRSHGKEASIDYRHIIWSLVRKPGAFARYRYREELFPTLTFRRTYDALKGWRGERADVDYVRILHLAAATMEADVECALELLLERGERFDHVDVKELASPEEQSVPEIHIPEPELGHYDELIGACR